jgi:signal transduction histidine kinase
VLWALVIGFGLVVVLLGLAGLVAVRDSHAIRQSSSGLVKEQLLIARLLYEVQAEEDALAHVLHLLVESEDVASRAKVLDDLKEADRDVSRLAIEAAQTPHASEWRRLAHAAQGFSNTAKQALNFEGPLPKNVLESLFASHDEVVKLIHDLILQSTRHLSEVNQEIEMQLDDLAEESKMLLGACLVFAALSAILTIRFVRHSIRRIRWQSDELNRVSWHMLQTQEESARRFSHELHDELGQSLAAVRTNLTRGSTQDFDSLRNDCLGLVDESIANVRELSQLLRPVILDDFGLEAGLRWLVEKFAQRTRLEVKVDTDCTGRFADETETHLFRIAQEALTNIARHAEATSVTLKLLREGKTIRLSISDDGKGMPPESSEARSSVGMVGMRARARQCGGELTITPVEPQGVCVEVVVPALSNEEFTS